MARNDKEIKERLEASVGKVVSYRIWDGGDTRDIKTLCVKENGGHYFIASIENFIDGGRRPIGLAPLYQDIHSFGRDGFIDYNRGECYGYLTNDKNVEKQIIEKWDELKKENKK